jgi:hypothetical protein
MRSTFLPQGTMRCRNKYRSASPPTVLCVLVPFEPGPRELSSMPLLVGAMSLQASPPFPDPDIQPEPLRHGSSSQGCGGAKTACSALMTLILLLMLGLKRIRKRDLN